MSRHDAQPKSPRDSDARPQDARPQDDATSGEDLAIRIENVGKMYKVFPSRWENFVDALGLHRLLPWRARKFREFWALRGIDLSVRRGQRIGIIGCNGAGKSTLLKLITGNIPPTEGHLSVAGEVHALMSTGAGFHPEFTGRENIEASLIYQGLSTVEIAAAIEEISEFTELAEFIDQPFKTYSAGMQARLTFATATTIQPDILIIDEILGAGDGYFISKSTERITRLVEETGATVLIVTHALEMTVRFCEEAIWIDRGRVVQRGNSLEVVKAYQKYLRERNERRLRAKNQARTMSAERASVEQGYYGATISAQFLVSSESSSEGALSRNSPRLDLTEISLLEAGATYERLAVGGPQDAETSRAAHVCANEDSTWSDPMVEGSQHFRSVGPPSSDRGQPAGVNFYLYSLLEEAEYAVLVRYRLRGKTRARALLWTDGELCREVELTGAEQGWQEMRLAVPRPRQPETMDAAEQEDAQVDAPTDEVAPDADAASETLTGRAVQRWAGEGSISIEDVVFLDAERQRRASFEAGQTFFLHMRIRAVESGRFPLKPTASVYRLDGIPVTRFIGEESDLELEEGETRVLELELGALNLGNDHYVVSVGAFRKFDAANPNEAEPYEIIDRSFEFEVHGNSPDLGAIFQHPGSWRELAPSDEVASEAQSDGEETRVAH